MTIKQPSLAVLGITVLMGCADTKTPRVEAWRGGAWESLSVERLRISGARDGEQTDASAVFMLTDGRELSVELSVVYNPMPSLESGRWRMGEGSGEVVAESLKFLGGQGEGPSLGGRFRLEQNGTHAYRVTIPLQTLR